MFLRKVLETAMISYTWNLYLGNYRCTGGPEMLRVPKNSAVSIYSCEIAIYEIATYEIVNSKLIRNRYLIIKGWIKWQRNSGYIFV